MVDFAGWAMPIQYRSILEEARAVRTAWGLFDVSHMARADFRGENAFALLSKLVPSDLTKLADGHSTYTVLTNEQGGVVDDIIIYRLSAIHYLVVFNAANREKDLEWFHRWAGGFNPAPTIHDRTEQTVMIAVQGPQAVPNLERLFGQPLSEVPRFGAIDLHWDGELIFAGRTGYTGEDGFELIADNPVGERLWNALVWGGATPCGLGARDVLRVEAGLHLYGHELTDRINPIEAGLGWLVSEREDYLGAGMIQPLKASGTPRKLMGIVMEERVVPREGYPVLIDEQPVGVMSSGVFSPTLERGIGMAFIDAAAAKVGTPCLVEIRGKAHPATITTRRFLKKKDGEKRP